MANGESQWITGPEARADVQRLRGGAGAILTGVATVIADDPSLTVRDARFNPHDRQPLRVVLDSKLRTPTTARMLSLDGETLIFCGDDAKAGPLQDAGASVVKVAMDEQIVDPAAVLQALAVREVNDVLVEAGPTVAGQLLMRQLVDELVIYQAPHILGSETRGMVTTPAWRRLADRATLNITDISRLGVDLRIIATPDYN
jgi:diaminohydroxyphosphoribosylaminopyrimidine deaminase/5-amino-6-(5-phosphoribosylamino)uracil reductase